MRAETCRWLGIKDALPCGEVGGYLSDSKEWVWSQSPLVPGYPGARDASDRCVITPNYIQVAAHHVSLQTLSELLICMTDDSRTVDMPIFHVCMRQICHPLVHPILQNTKVLTPDNQHGIQRLMFYHRRSHPLCKSKAPYYMPDYVHVTAWQASLQLCIEALILVTMHLVATRWQRWSYTDYHYILCWTYYQIQKGSTRQVYK